MLEHPERCAANAISSRQPAGVIARLQPENERIPVAVVGAARDPAHDDATGAGRRVGSTPRSESAVPLASWGVAAPSAARSR